MGTEGTERGREREQTEKKEDGGDGKRKFLGGVPREREREKKKKQTRKRSNTNRRVKCFILKHCFHSIWLNVDFTGVESKG